MTAMPGPYGPLPCYCCAKDAAVTGPDGRALCVSCAREHAAMTTDQIHSSIRGLFPVRLT